jgi:selT/selW/selH-like putative selenoprotein
LKREFGVDAELIEGSNGVFDVTVNGRLIFSKDKLFRFPDDGEITKLIRSTG